MAPVTSYSGPSSVDHYHHSATPAATTAQQQPHAHKHKRIYSVDDDMWSVMKEPLPLLEDLDTEAEGEDDNWR